LQQPRPFNLLLSLSSGQMKNWTSRTRTVSEERSRMKARQFSAILFDGNNRLFSPGAPNFCSHMRASYQEVSQNTRAKLHELFTHLLDPRMNEEPRIPSSHCIQNAFFSFFIINIISPCWEGNGDRMRCMWRKRQTQRDGGHDS
jgi:hypothetical protein